MHHIFAVEIRNLTQKFSVFGKYFIRGNYVDEASKDTSLVQTALIDE
jgi:hypothetical protein